MDKQNDCTIEDTEGTKKNWKISKKIDKKHSKKW